MLPCWTLTLAPRWRPVAQRAEAGSYNTALFFSWIFVAWAKKTSWPPARGFIFKKRDLNTKKCFCLVLHAEWIFSRQKSCQPSWYNPSFVGSALPLSSWDSTKKKMKLPKWKLIYTENQMSWDGNRKEECGKADLQSFCLYLRLAAHHWGGNSDSGPNHGHRPSATADKETLWCRTDPQIVPQHRQLSTFKQNPYDELLKLFIDKGNG